MSQKTQGTQLYTIDPDDQSVLKVAATTSIDGIDAAVSELDDTTLEDMARKFKAGLAEPGTATFGINVDTATAAHVRLYELKKQGVTLKWALGWSDGLDIPPTVEAGEFVLPPTRSWLDFQGHLSAYPFSFAQNAFVSSSIGIRLSGDINMTPKAPVAP
ncbi:phage tail tube protein [Halopseudomonas laoshanensis]|uniref:phage tail tube protein n=1 Tax=Halopseudomonas laoshanensis TaxID=2268758 RepID=UPI003736DFF0